MTEAGIVPSVGSVGDSYDNALAESINGLLNRARFTYKAEAILEYATLGWDDWFNNRCLLQPIGNIPPVEAEQRYYDMLDEPAMIA